MKQMTITCGACGASQHITPGELAYTCTECQASSRYMENDRTWVWDNAVESRPAVPRGAVWWLTVVLFVVGIVVVLALLGIL